MPNTALKRNIGLRIAANEDNLHNPFNLHQEYEILPSNRKIAGYVELSIPEGLITPEATYVAPYYFEDVCAVGNPNNITDALVDGNPRVENLYPQTNADADPDSDAEGSAPAPTASPDSLKYMGQVFGIVEAPISDKKSILTSNMNLCIYTRPATTQQRIV